MYYLEEEQTLYEYLGIIPPCITVTADVAAMKLQCKVEEGWEEAVWSKPHFTVFNLVQPRFNEPHFANCLRRLAANTKPFNLDLFRFDYFGGSAYTLYIKPRNEKPFADFAKQTKANLKQLLRPLAPYRPLYTLKPHLTIAKNIPEEEFLKAWPKWKNKQYQTACPANGFLLLKRELGSGKRYDIAGDYPFLSEGKLGYQLHLF